ncbi:MAG: GNAT family N-acetyltransferase [Lentisphaeria bacterium]
MNYRLLEWDSRFFGMRVAQAIVDSTLESHRLSECLKYSDAEVIYVVLPSNIVELYRPVLENFSSQCYDRKITFKKPVNSTFATWDRSIIETTTEQEELLQLAYASGHLSRFFLDPRFNPHFKALYGEWLRKALREEGSKVFVLSDFHCVQGMVTASVENGVGKIGLLAINEKYRGKGFGMRLLKQCEAYYDSLCARTCTVVTQKTNIAACNLYHKMGYIIENEQDIWHIWKK